jgi:FSR family fosmidomycin resistance protein-like MFS transporter
MSAIGVAPSYNILAVLLIIGGLGIAAFHPQTVSLAGSASGSRKGLGVSIFISGGTVGYALGPLWMVSLVMAVGLKRSMLAALPGLIFVGFMLRGNILRDKLQTMNRSLSLSKSFGPQAKAISILFAVVVLWTGVRMGFISLLPILYAQRGYSLISGGGVITLFVISGALGGLIGGHISDRLERRTVIIMSLMLSAPFLYAFVKASGPLSIFLLALAGMFLMGSSSVVIAMAQELIPENVGMASSIVMGFAWGVGGFLVVIFGMIAEKWSTPLALTGLSLLPLASSFCALFLPHSGIKAFRTAVHEREGERC